MKTTASPTFSLDQIRTASPCPMRWSDMKGDDTKRFCKHCSLHVFNLTNMTRADAEALILGAEGRLCTTYFRRADGTILTKDCPVGIAEIRRKRIRIAAAVGALLSFGAGAFATRALANPKLYAVRTRLSALEPFRTVRAWIAPPPPLQGGAVMMGAMVVISPSQLPPIPNPLASPRSAKTATTTAATPTK